jgi:hypothetical protein
MAMPLLHVVEGIDLVGQGTLAKTSSGSSAGCQSGLA